MMIPLLSWSSHRFDCLQVYHWWRHSSQSIQGTSIQRASKESILFPNVTIGPEPKCREPLLKRPPYSSGFEIGYLERDRQIFHVTDSGIVVLAKDTIIKA